MQVLSERMPDAILLDIEMPRMDGFEFTKTVKADARTAHIPIIMITSRTAEKHRNRARELGVEMYLGKPFQEEELLASAAGGGGDAYRLARCAATAPSSHAARRSRAASLLSRRRS